MTVIAVIDIISMKLQITENNVLILDSTPIYHAYDITIQSHAKLVQLSIFY